MRLCSDWLNVRTNEFVCYEKMAENCVLKTTRRMRGRLGGRGGCGGGSDGMVKSERKRSFVRFSGNDFKTHLLQKNSILEQIVKSVRNGERVWRTMCSLSSARPTNDAHQHQNDRNKQCLSSAEEDEDEEEENSFEGFENKNRRTENKKKTSEQKAEPETETETEELICCAPNMNYSQHKEEQSEEEEACMGMGVGVGVGAAADESQEPSNRIQRLLREQWEQRIRQLDRDREETGGGAGAGEETGQSEEGGQARQDAQGHRKSEEKSILRKARLQINKRTLLRIRRAQRWEQLSSSMSSCPSAEQRSPSTGSTHAHQCLALEASDEEQRRTCVATNKQSSLSNSRSGQPGFITCAICNATKYYSHVQRRYGVFSCEPCSKFFARFIKEPKQYFCAKSGDCPIGDGDCALQPRTGAGAGPHRDCAVAAQSRSRANVSAHRCKACWLKVCLQKFALDAQQRQLIATEFWPRLVRPPNVALITVDCTNSNSACLAADDVNRKSDLRSERQSLLMVASERVSDVRPVPPPPTAKRGPRVKRVCRSAGIVNGLPLATFATTQTSDSQCADADSDELPVDVYLCRALNDSRKRKQSCSSAVKKFRCRQCVGCLAQDCGQCSNCKDKKKFGGQNVIKQACRLRRCTRSTAAQDYDGSTGD